MSEKNQTRQPSQIGSLIPTTTQAMQRKQGTYRAQRKPRYARFKASIEYINQMDKKPMFSYDWNGGKDNEEIGLESLKLWALKCLKSEKLISIRIFMTDSLDKSTDVMDFDTKVFDFDRTMDLNNFKPIPQLRFNNGKVIFDEIMYNEIRRQKLERQRLQALLNRH